MPLFPQTSSILGLLLPSPAKELVDNHYRRFCTGIQHFRNEINDELDEMLTFAEVMARQQNMITVDENGIFFSTASGSLDEIIPTLTQQIEKLERIRRQRNHN
jgi:type II secretory pathway component PulF